MTPVPGSTSLDTSYETRPTFPAPRHVSFGLESRHIRSYQCSANSCQELPNLRGPTPGSGGSVTLFTALLNILASRGGYFVMSPAVVAPGT